MLDPDPGQTHPDPDPKLREKRRKYSFSCSLEKEMTIMTECRQYEYNYDYLHWTFAPNDIHVQVLLWQEYSDKNSWKEIRLQVKTSIYYWKVTHKNNVFINNDILKLAKGFGVPFSFTFLLILLFFESVSHLYHFLFIVYLPVVSMRRQIIICLRLYDFTRVLFNQTLY